MHKITIYDFLKINRKRTNLRLGWSVICLMFLTLTTMSLEAQNTTTTTDKSVSESSQIPTGYEKLIGRWMYREVKEIGSDYWGSLYEATYWEFHENQKFIWYGVGLVGQNKGKIISRVEATWSISGNELVLTLEDGKTVANKNHIISVDDQVLEITTKYTNGTRGYRLISEKHPKFHDYLINN